MVYVFAPFFSKVPKFCYFCFRFNRSFIVNCRYDYSRKEKESSSELRCVLPTPSVSLKLGKLAEGSCDAVV